MRRGAAIVLLGMAVAAVTVGGVSCAFPEEDTRIGAPLPAARTEVAGTLWRDRVVVAGGLDAAGEPSARVDLYDATDDTWSGAPPLPVAIHHAAVVVDGEDRLHVIGGYRDQGGTWLPEDRTWLLDAPDGRWSEGPRLVTPRGALAAATADGAVLAIGGVGPDGTVLSSTERLAADAQRWRPGPALATPREHLAATAVDARTFVVAGRAGGLDTNRDTVERIVGDEVTPVPPVAVARGGFGAGSVGGAPCVAGGERPGGTIAEVECLRADGWETVGRLRTPRHGVAVVARGVHLHIVAGGPRPGLTVSDSHEIIRVD